MQVRNRCRLVAAAVFVLCIVVVYAAALLVYYINGIRADNRMLYEVVVEQQEYIRGKGLTCERLLDDPVVGRIMKAR